MDKTDLTKCPNCKSFYEIGKNQIEFPALYEAGDGRHLIQIRLCMEAGKMEFRATLSEKLEHRHNIVAQFTLAATQMRALLSWLIPLKALLNRSIRQENKMPLSSTEVNRVKMLDDVDFTEVA